MVTLQNKIMNMAKIFVKHQHVSLVRHALPSTAATMAVEMLGGQVRRSKLQPEFGINNNIHKKFLFHGLFLMIKDSY